MVFCHSSSSFFLCSVNAAKCFKGIINGNHIPALEYSEIFGSNSLSVWNRGRARSSKIEHIHHIQLNLARHKSFSTNLYIWGKMHWKFQVTWSKKGKCKICNTIWQETQSVRETRESCNEGQNLWTISLVKSCWKFACEKMSSMYLICHKGIQTVHWTFAPTPIGIADSEWQASGMASSKQQRNLHSIITSRVFRCTFETASIWHLSGSPCEGC